MSVIMVGFSYGGVEERERRVVGSGGSGIGYFGSFYY